MGVQGRFLPDGSEASVKTVSGAVSAHPDENFEVNINKHSRLGRLTPSARRCAGERCAHFGGRARFHPSRKTWFAASQEPRHVFLPCQQR